MRALTILLPTAALLGACQVTENPGNNSSTVTLSGEAAKNGTASALDSATKAINGAANKVDAVSNDASNVRSGLSNLTASAERLGKSVGGAADRAVDAADGKRVGGKSDRTSTATTTNTTNN